MKKLIIDRSRWMRGGMPMVTCDDGTRSLRDGCLIDNDDYQCCLGFYAFAEGADPYESLNQPLPGDVLDLDEHSWLMASTGWSDSGRVNTVQEALAWINDAELLDDATREAWLTEGFRVLGGIEVEFVDGPVQP
jgi:hypothetical protein